MTRHLSPAQIDELIKTLDKNEIIGIECKHVCYSESAANDSDDLHVIKEVVHTKNHGLLPRIRKVENFQRDFYVTKEPFRNHSRKKEWEDIGKLNRFTTNQRNLLKTVVRALGRGNPKHGLKRLAKSPYLYGTDISPKAILKYNYQKKFPGLTSKNRVAALDIETDVINGTDEIIICSITLNDRVFVAVNSTWVKGIVGLEEQVSKVAFEALGPLLKARGVNIELFLSDNPGELVHQTMVRAHEWQPDFVSIWNIDFDLPKMVSTLKRHGYDPADVFSDPRVPHEYRYFKYEEGNATRRRDDGTEFKLAWYEIWNYAECPASFFFIDAAVVYRIIRTASGKEPSYALDAILKKHGISGKLYFDCGAKYAAGKIDWHIEMQRKFKIEYIVYNIFDCIGLELLDEATTDLSMQIGMIIGFAEYDIFNSNPKMTASDLHYFVKDRDKVIGSLSSNMVEDVDNILQEKTEWIVTLTCHNVDDNGLTLYHDLFTVRSMIRKFVADADITSTYPHGEIAQNIGKATTYFELARIKGIDEQEHRVITVSLVGGPSNAVEIMTRVCNAPGFIDMGRYYDEDIRQAA